LQKKWKILSVPQRIKVYSPAKINLYLNIIEQYRDGFHKIESIINRINLFDEITIEVTSGEDIYFSCNKKNLEKEDNLCVKVASLLKEKYNLKYGLNIYLKKNIPIGGGLGGGSSNAASVILGVNKILNLKLSFEELTKIGRQLGSDVNFFLAECPWAYVEGRGEKVKPLDISTRLHYLLVYPNIPISTADIYRKTKVGLTKFIDNVNILIHALKRQDYLLVEKTSYNALEKSAMAVCKKLRDIKISFRKGGFFCQLTGSGSTLFVLLRNYSHTIKKKINALAQKMREKGFLVFLAQTY